MTEFNISPDVEEWVLERRGRLHAYDKFEPSNAALLVVDMQNYFLDPVSPACCEAAQKIVPNINYLARSLRQAGGHIFWIKTEATEEVRLDWPNLCELYTPEINEKRFSMLHPHSHYSELADGLQIFPNDEIVVKTRYSAFIQGSSEIERQLRRRNVETVLVAGTATNVCCDSTARDAMMLGFRTIMVSDANAAFSSEEHRVALNTFLRVFGDVQSTEQLVASLSNRELVKHPG